MSKGGIVALGIVGVLVVGAVMFIGWIVGSLNKDTNIRVAVEQKQVDNKNQFANLKSKISKTAQVSEKAMESLEKIFNGYAEARKNGDGEKLIMNWIKESVPNVDLTTMNNLQNIITGSCDSFTMKQTELTDLKREHDKILRTIPDCFIYSFFGRKPIDIVIVTSTATEAAFKTGKDDDDVVFKK
jgi:hypothetical protein